MSHPTTVRFDEAEYRQLREIAQRRGTTVSELVRNAVRSVHLREDRQRATNELLEYIEDNPDPREGDLDEIEKKIRDGFRDAGSGH